MDDTPTDLICAALGQTLADVAAASSYPFDFRTLQDDDLITVGQPVKFRYAGAHGFDLPPTRFIGLTATAALVTAIDMSPQLNYLDAASAMALADHVAAQATAAGWRTISGGADVIGREELAVLMTDTSLPTETSWHIALLALETARLLFRLRRMHPAGGYADRALFLLNLQWRDDLLADCADKIAADLRREDGLPTDRWRHIDLNLYAPRVVRALRRMAHP